MNMGNMASLAGELLAKFCVDIPTRRLGSEGNRQASAVFDAWMGERGFIMERQEFDCQDWETEGASLLAAGQCFSVFSSPHSNGCRVIAPLGMAASLEELEKVDAAGKILLLYGEITASQLMPKGYPFYFPDEHRRIYDLLEEKQPAAIITATGCNPELAGAMYPFPMIEDGSFDIPSVYMTDVEGVRLAALAGQQVELVSNARRIDSHGWNSVAKINPQIQSRVVLCAHIDAKPGTPGALDNASGVITLMLLGERLRQSPVCLGVDILIINGEDHYQARGEVVYLERMGAKIQNVSLAINLDGLGHVGDDVACSLYGCPEDLAETVRRVLSAQPGMLEGDPWYQGDHMVFLQNGRPAVAITSGDLGGLMSQITHTAKDSPDQVDPSRLAQTALALHELLQALDEEGAG